MGAFGILGNFVPHSASCQERFKIRAIPRQARFGYAYRLVFLLGSDFRMAFGLGAFHFLDYGCNQRVPGKNETASHNWRFGRENQHLKLQMLTN